MSVGQAVGHKRAENGKPLCGDDQLGNMWDDPEAVTCRACQLLMDNANKLVYVVDGYDIEDEKDVESLERFFSKKSLNDLRYIGDDLLEIKIEVSRVTREETPIPKGRKYAPPMKAADLIKVLQEGIEKHGEDVVLMFDTEAHKYDYHMAVIGSAYAEEFPEPHIGLHEVRMMLSEDEQKQMKAHMDKVLSRSKPDE